MKDRTCNLHVQTIFRDLLLLLVQECCGGCYAPLCMQMSVPHLADSQQGSSDVNCYAHAVDDPDTDSGWQQSKSIWALSAEVGKALRMQCGSP